MASREREEGGIRACVDRWIVPRSTGTGDAEHDPNRLAAARAFLWPASHRVLHVRFLDGAPALHSKVARFAREWTAHANVALVFDNAADAPIRISFSPGPSWSLIGTQALDPSIGADEPTMNFGWLTPATLTDEVRRVVLHEFGHALGLIHEHQNPDAEIPWDHEAVYRFYGGAPNFWTREQVDQNLFLRYSLDQTNFSRFDPQSIMLYPIPPEFTQNRLTVGMNKTLSRIDRQHMRRIYPFPGDPGFGDSGFCNSGASPEDPAV